MADPIDTLPSAEDLVLVADLDEFNRAVNAAITVFLGKGHHEVMVAHELRQHATAVSSGRRVLHNMMNRIIIRHADHKEQRRELESRMRDAVVLSPTREMRKRVHEAKRSLEEPPLLGAGRSAEDEARVFNGALHALLRRHRLGLIDPAD